MEKKKQKVKAIGVISGGLDSMLALKLMGQQGLDITAFHLQTVFFSPLAGLRPIAPRVKQLCDSLGIPLIIQTRDQEFIEMLKVPAHGYGSNINPCIDCKIFIFRIAKEIMKEKKARFIFTGEVVGQRPMTQNKSMLRHIEKEAGLDSLILRPLSARILPMTIPEKEGWIRREKLFGFSGRSRKPQMALAKQLGITEYPTPAGGCLLTDPGFAERLKDLFDNGVYELNDISLLKLGRHFRFSPETKLIVGRRETENLSIAKLAQEDDVLLQAVGVGSPLCLLRGQDKMNYLELATQICKRYSDAREQPTARIQYWLATSKSPQIITVSAPPDEEFKKYQVV